jgi:hypothetical protein
MFDSPNDLLRHHKRISLVTEHKDNESEEERLSCQSYADYVLARATARMLLDHGIEHEEFMAAMCDELEHRGSLDDD